MRLYNTTCCTHSLFRFMPSSKLLGFSNNYFHNSVITPSFSKTPKFSSFITATMSTVSTDKNQTHTPPLQCKRDYTSVMVVLTGIGAAIGGFAGDTLPVARALSSIVDCLITHPNVLNAAMLYWPMPNALYVEGYALDRFAEGSWVLQPVHQNRVGIVLDAGIEEELQIRQLQVADAARASDFVNVLVS